ncbi:hypothetical protein PACTADRAFT_49495, partial [Pachysolen tannophilus NRRL Y-2460]
MTTSLLSPNIKTANHNKLFSPKFNVVKKDWKNDSNCNPSLFQDNSISKDRFITTIHKTLGRVISSNEKLPEPSESPSIHLNAQNNIIYKESVAKACGIELHSRILKYQQEAPERRSSKNSTSSKPTSTESSNNTDINSTKTKHKLAAAHSRSRRIPTTAHKVLDAPGFLDDFYLNLLEWSSENLLAIALEDTVYVWNSTTGSVNSVAQSGANITSLSWSDDGSYLSVAKDNIIEIYDIETNQKLRQMTGMDSRVGVHKWHDHLITSGTRSGSMHHHDVRISNHIVSNLNGHQGEVCGIEWRSDGFQLCSGGNDNIVNIWDARSTSPQFTKTAHTAAVKALSWCPSQLSLLATGGGSADKKIHFWNTITGARVNTIDTGSQISSLSWGYANGIGREICATHGYPDNSITMWAYPSLQKTGTVVNAHDSRILQSALSPDGLILGTVAADESLKFWKFFDLPKHKSESSSSLISEDRSLGKIMTI